MRSPFVDSPAGALWRQPDLAMGLNTENMFVRSATSDAVVTAVEEHLQGASASSGIQSGWPLEVTFNPSRATPGRRISVSDPSSGWVAVVESSETVEPALAAHLSSRLATRVVVAQVYEVTGSSGYAVWEQGVVQGGPTRHDRDDPLGDVMAALAKEGVLFAPLLFRETVGRGVVGWRTISLRTKSG